MVDEESWACPSCGASYEMDVRQCPSCRVSRIHRAPTGPARSPVAVPESGPPKRETVEVVLPCFIPEARYSMVVPGGGGASWTGGVVYCTSAGLYFLSEKDGFTGESKAAEAAREPSPAPKRISPLSVFVPAAMLVRLVHGQFAGNFIEMKDLKIPLRLTNDGWDHIIGVCRKLGVKIDA